MNGGGGGGAGGTHTSTPFSGSAWQRPSMVRPSSEKWQASPAWQPAASLDRGRRAEAGSGRRPATPEANWRQVPPMVSSSCVNWQASPACLPFAGLHGGVGDGGGEPAARTRAFPSAVARHTPVKVLPRGSACHQSPELLPTAGPAPLGRRPAASTARRTAPAGRRVVPRCSLGSMSLEIWPLAGPQRRRLGRLVHAEPRGQDLHGVCRANGRREARVRAAGSPPPSDAAVQACNGKQAGDACPVHARRRHHRRHWPPIRFGRAGLRPEPASAASPVEACQRRCTAGDACHFSDDGRTIDGLCHAPPGEGSAGVPSRRRLLLRRRSSRPATGSRRAIPCTVTSGDRTLNGVCQQIPGGPLACCRRSSPPPPPVQACSGKSAGDSCSFMVDSKTVSGVCRDLPERNLPRVRPATAPAAHPGLQREECWRWRCTVTEGDKTFIGTASSSRQRFARVICRRVLLRPLRCRPARARARVTRARSPLATRR